MCHWRRQQCVRLPCYCLQLTPRRRCGGAVPGGNDRGRGTGLVRPFALCGGSYRVMFVYYHRAVFLWGGTLVRSIWNRVLGVWAVFY